MTDGRRAYLDGKYDKFQASPLKFYFTLDLAFQRKFIEGIRGQFLARATSPG